jgi:hypothetical protein
MHDEADAMRPPDELRWLTEVVRRVPGNDQVLSTSVPVPKTPRGPRASRGRHTSSVARDTVVGLLTSLTPGRAHLFIRFSSEVQTEGLHEHRELRFV